MNIQINLPEPQIEGNLKIVIYNTIKRSEEDFLRRIPSLIDFTVTVKKVPDSSISIGNFPINAKHSLSEDETTLALQIGYRSLAVAEKIVDALTSELKKIKISYE